MLLNDQLKNYQLLLASHSPRRQQLLRDSGINYTLIDKYEVEELYPPTMAAEEVPLFLSQLKSDAYPTPLAPHEVLLTADTVVVLKGKVLGKPHDRNEAVQMLGDLSGERHTVITGVTLRSATHRMSFDARTDVWFRPLRHEEILYYVDTFRPMDKAGSYGIQEWIGYAAIERIEGSFYNVMGLPIQKVYVELEKFLK
ncbi:MAG: Maf family nucleotide pyrophosphatase [Alistipes sp.]